MQGKYWVNTTSAVRQRTGWQTDRRRGCSETITIIMTIYKVKSSQVRQRRSRIIRSSSSVHLALTNCLSSSEGYRGWRRETHHRRSRYSSARSWTGAQTEQISTATTTTSPGGTAKEDNISSDVNEDITTTSCSNDRRSWQVRDVESMIGSSSRNHHNIIQASVNIIIGIRDNSSIQNPWSAAVEIIRSLSNHCPV